RRSRADRSPTPSSPRRGRRSRRTKGGSAAYATAGSPPPPWVRGGAEPPGDHNAGFPPPQRRPGARDTPALAWIAGSIHSNEPSGADADMRLLYELAARRGCDHTPAL